MKTKQVDTMRHSCPTTEERGTFLISVQEGPCMQDVCIPDEMIADSLEALIHFPKLISLLDEEIADALIEREFFIMSEFEVSITGRDFLSVYLTQSKKID